MLIVRGRAPIALVCPTHSLRKSFAGRAQPVLQCSLCVTEASQRRRAQHPWKTIWLRFVRRAYRRFGRQQLAQQDLRWKATGRQAMADAINRLQPSAARSVEPRELDSGALAERMGRSWVVTWPKRMRQLDVGQLLLLKTEAAMHRSR